MQTTGEVDGKCTSARVVPLANEDDGDACLFVGQSLTDQGGEVGEVLRDHHAASLGGRCVDSSVVSPFQPEFHRGERFVPEVVQCAGRCRRQHLVD